MDTYLVSTHECDGQTCDKPARVRRTVKLGCGCTRHECDRHDGTVGVHFLTGGCGHHEPDDVAEAKAVADLVPGDRFLFAPINRVVTVVAVAPTGSVKFGQVGPDATPILSVSVDGMPRPFAGRFETAADSVVQVAQAVTR